ncbi:MAG TPA: glycosyltransferase family 4 protein [Sedimentisphaerales bacterium]
MRVLFALPGLHRYNRGAEVAFMAIASAIAKAGNAVTLIGSGKARSRSPYQFLHAGSVPRETFERFPSIPLLRNESAYEELTFVPSLLRCYRPTDYDVTLTCGYPFTNWSLRHPLLRGSRPRHVFVTENGDWPAFSRKSEYRLFGCDGLVCTNPEFYERNKDRWRCQLIPNGVDCDRFQPGIPQRQEFGLPANGLVVLMVSALVPNKRVDAGIEAVSRIPGAHLVVAGDGPLRQTVDACAARLLPDRFTRLLVSAEKMPTLYQSANVFLHLCEDESFGNVFLEAMACGLPVVAHDSSNTRWIVGNDEFLVDNRDPATISRYIETARDASFPARTKRVAKAAAFSWTRIGEMYSKFLKDVINSPENKLAPQST